jgi:hypothetical protein
MEILSTGAVAFRDSPTAGGFSQGMWSALEQHLVAEGSTVLLLQCCRQQQQHMWQGEGDCQQSAAAAAATAAAASSAAGLLFPQGSLASNKISGSAGIMVSRKQQSAAWALLC